MRTNNHPEFRAYQTHANQLIEAALAAVDPAAKVQQHLKRNGRSLTIGSEIYNLEEGGVYLISVGKAAVPMALAAREIVGDLLLRSIIVTKKSTKDWSQEIENSNWSLNQSAINLFQSGHPIPDEESVRAAAAVLDLLAQTTPGDLVLCLISGGASALLACPLLPLTDWQKLTDALLASGCTINELNCVRRQLDRVKGGGLARASAPAACASLILSDVIGNSLSAIGSGPTVFTNETGDDALAVLERYQIKQKLETAVWQNIVSTLKSTRAEAEMKPARNQHLIIGDVRQAANAALARAAQLGFIAQILTTKLEGEAREAGRFAAALAKDAPGGRCLLLGGETTVTLRGKGQGGRNLELALAAAVNLEGWPDRAIITFASDGEDGTTGAAGAMVTGETAVTARRINLNPMTYLDNNDSFTFFQQLDQLTQDGAVQHLIFTGPTGTNVNDLLIILTYNET